MRGRDVVAGDQGLHRREDVLRAVPLPAVAASAPGSETRSPTTCSPSSPAGSTRSSAAPASTWAFITARTSRTRPATGARTAVSIFMLSRTTIVWPGLDVVADGGADGDDDGRRGGADHALLVAA